jgi:allantoate deiminase
VIPGAARLSLDVRHPEDLAREAACARLQESAQEIGAARSVAFESSVIHQAQSVTCDPRLTELLSRVVKWHQHESLLLTSGAGHDAAALAAITPVAMLFVRCRGGISHHPDELATREDVQVALSALDDFLPVLAQNHE